MIAGARGTTPSADADAPSEADPEAPRPAVRRIRPRRLQHQMIGLLALILAAAMLMLWIVTDRRIDEVATSSSQEWADAMARAAASASTEPMAGANHAAMEAVLREIATLPGVLRIDAVDGTGLPLLRLRADGMGRVTAVWRLADASPTAAATWRALGSDVSETLQRWQPVGPDGALGQVGVTFALSRDRAHVERLRWDALMGIAVVGVLTVGGAQLLLWRTLQPLHRLLRFARRLAQRPGEQLLAEGGSLEVEQLTEALNEASRALREQFDAVQASEARMNGIVDAAPDAIIGFDADGVITIASPAVASIFGCEPAALPGTRIGALLPELDGDGADRRTLGGQYRRSSGSHVVQWETLAVRHGGTPFPVELSLARSASDRGPRFTCVVRDITERRMADELLHLYGQALECASNGIVIADVSLPGAPVFYANAAFETITGYPRSEAIGRNCGFLQGDDREQPELPLIGAAVREGRSAKVVLRNYRRDGTLFFNELSIAPVTSAEGRVKYYVGVQHDVTERERSRLAIAERSARLNAVFDLSPDGLVVFDREGSLVVTNRVFLAMTGWGEPGALHGLKLDEFDRRMGALADPSQPWPPLSMEGSDDGGFETIDQLFLSLPRPRVLTRLVRHNAGGQGESILYFRDITAETEVDRMKSEFLTTAAHELRTPMVSVYGFTELLLSRPVPEERRRDVLQTIHRQASLLITMVNELLDLARIEARQGKDLRLEPRAVAELMRQAPEGLAGSTTSSHEIRMHLPDDACRVLADGEKMQRALTNVLSNAVKYSPAGGTIDVSCTPGELRGRPAIGLRVQDQGIGMTSAQLARVFERFYRADPSGTIPGTGLGMSLVKEIIELHQGEVAIDSVPGQGTCVTLWLPLLDRPAAPALAHDAAARDTPGSAGQALAIAG